MISLGEVNGDRIDEPSDPESESLRRCTVVPGERDGLVSRFSLSLAPVGQDFFENRFSVGRPQSSTYVGACVKQSPSANCDFAWRDP